MSVKQTVDNIPIKLRHCTETFRDDDQLAIATALSIRKNTSKAMPSRKATPTLSTIRMTVGAAAILFVCWKQLEADIEAGKVCSCNRKDMSRIGRDYLQTSFYTEVFFRSWRSLYCIATA